MVSAKPRFQLSVSNEGEIVSLPNSREASAGPTTIKQMKLTATVSIAPGALQGGAAASGTLSFAINDISRRSKGFSDMFF